MLRVQCVREIYRDKPYTYLYGHEMVYETYRDVKSFFVLVFRVETQCVYPTWVAPEQMCLQCILTGCRKAIKRTGIRPAVRCVKNKVVKSIGTIN